MVRTQFLREGRPAEPAHPSQSSSILNQDRASDASCHRPSAPLPLLTTTHSLVAHEECYRLPERHQTRVLSR